MSSIGRVELSSRWWKSSRPESVLGRKLEGALKRYESLDEDDQSALREALESLSAAAADAAKECARQEEDDVEQALRELVRMITRRKKDCCGHEEEEEDEEEEEPHATGLDLDPEGLRKHMRMLAKGPLPFAFGVGSGGMVAFVLDRKRKGPSLMAKLKQASGCQSATFGLASVEGKSLVLEVEGPSVSGIAKKLRTFLRDNQPLPYTQVRVAGDEEPDGPQVEPEPAPEPTPEPDVPLNMTRPYEISGSVGAGGRNHPDDVQMVQTQLNRLARAGLEVDGEVGPKTIEAIKAFQRSLGFTSADGRVDPGKTTDRARRGEKVAPPKQGGPARRPVPREHIPLEVERPYDPRGGERIHDRGYEEPGADHLQQAKELARRVLQQKQAADQRMQELKRAAASKAGEQAQKIVGKLEETYDRGAESVREVTRHMKELADMDRSTERAVREQQVENLKRVAELAMEGFQAVETGVGKGLEWIETRLQDVDARE